MTTHKNILVIFGITGDLSHRKLLPALHHMADEGYLSDTTILGISRREITTEQVFENFNEADHAHPLLREQLQVLTMDISEPSEYEKLKTKIAQLQDGHEGNVLFYLSVPPQASIPIVEMLGRAGLSGEQVKVLLEKPFGIDYESAHEAVSIIERYFSEDQLYRIDHYLAKEMVQNIIAFRSHNAIFRNLWHKDFIEKIDIIASEKIGIENRGQFYEQTGALRDVLQNHLMQLAALVLMDVPVDMQTKDIPAHRLRALQSIKAISPDHFSQVVQRGQYSGYDIEAQNPGSTTETFAAVTLFSDDVTWQGVPIRLATGKNLSKQTTEIRIYFKQAHEKESNLLVMHIQPKEGIEIDLVAKKPGYEKAVENVSLTFNYRAQEGRPVEAYERVLSDALTSDKSLFTTTEEVIRSWEILRPIQERWAFHLDDLTTYAPGTAIETLIDPTK